MSNDFKYLDKLIEISEKVSRIEVQTETITQDIKKIQIEDQKQNNLLAEHILGVETNQKRLDLEIKNRVDLEKRLDLEIKNRVDLEKRINQVERPQKFLLNLKVVALYITGLGTSVLVVLKIMGAW